MPREVFGSDYPFLPAKELLSFDEIVRVATVLARHGVRKLRLTGGEPLLRPHLENLIESLSHIDGIDDIAITTNGALLTPDKAHQLRDAGLKRITISLDSVNDAVFQKMNDVSFPVSRVLAAIDAAAAAGLQPVKVNAVVKRGLNDEGIEDIAQRFRNTGHIVRFIEFMDVGNTNHWKMDEVVPSDEIVERIGRLWPVEPIPEASKSEVARYFRYLDGGGTFGVISSVTRPFCGNCSRLRLSSDGKLYTCLFSGIGHDVKSRLRQGASDGELEDFLAGLWRARDDRYSEVRGAFQHRGDIVEMSKIGG